MRTFEKNSFKDTSVELDSAVFHKNFMVRCRLLARNPPRSFEGNRVVDSTLHFSGNVQRTVDFIRALSIANPEIRPRLREMLALECENSFRSPGNGISIV